MKNKLVDMGTMHRKYLAQSRPVRAASKLIDFPGDYLGSS